MIAIIGRKIGMTSLFDEKGINTPCTIIEAGPCVVTHVKTKEKDGYTAVQLGFGDHKEKGTPSALKGHFKKANTTPKTKVMEMRNFDIAKNVGDTVTVEVFAEGDAVVAIGTTKGKGFQGVVRRHGFSGVGGQTHGQHNRLRAPGSMGASSFPSRVFKGKRLGGRMGNARVKQAGLKILKIYPEKNLMVVSGNVPGYNNSFVVIQK